VTVTPTERRCLLKLGRKIGPAIKHLSPSSRTGRSSGGWPGTGPSPEACSGPCLSESGGYECLKRCRDDAGRSRNRSRFTGVPDRVCLHAGRKPDWMSKIAQLLPDRGPDGRFRRGKGLVEAPGAGTIMVKRPRWSRARGHPGNPDFLAWYAAGLPARRGAPREAQGERHGHS
jgi:hypothetical protein